MSTDYTKEAVLNELNEKVNSDVSGLYSDKIVNRKGKTSDTKELFTELIIKSLYSNKIISDKKITGINTKQRENSYYTQSHEKLVANINPKSNRNEEIYVKEVFKNNDFEAQFGIPIEYQVPLKNKQKDCLGKIDLITYKETENELYLIEVKAQKSKETALKTILEIQTYYQTVEQKELIKDLTITKVNKKYGNRGIQLKENPKILKGIIVFRDTIPAIELQDENRTQLQKLICDLIGKENIYIQQ